MVLHRILRVQAPAAGLHRQRDLAARVHHLLPMTLRSLRPLRAFLTFPVRAPEGPNLHSSRHKFRFQDLSAPDSSNRRTASSASSSAARPLPLRARLHLPRPPPPMALTMASPASTPSSTASASP
ncbi:hypothetical protein ACQ4PT_015175 [Festuca glaucescens]